MNQRSGRDDARDPALGWGAALTFASVLPGAGAMLGADILRVHVFELGLLGVFLGLFGGIGTLYECATLNRGLRR